MFEALSTEALARTSARRPWLVIAVWVVLLLSGVALRATIFEDGVTTQFNFTNTPGRRRV